MTEIVFKPLDTTLLDDGKAGDTYLFKYDGMSYSTICIKTEDGKLLDLKTGSYKQDLNGVELKKINIKIIEQ